MTKPTKRCALYTRKSSEEGLEQDFNSLDAQREACAAYVTSQASEGWRAIDIHYDGKWLYATRYDHSDARAADMPRLLHWYKPALSDNHQPSS